MSKYQVLGVVGEGAYGVVMKCRNKKTGEYVAMKKFKETGEQDEAVRKTILREVKVLKLMRHVEPVVQLLESFRRKGRLYLVFEYVERNLLEVIEAHPDGCPMALVERFMYQLCGAIQECHRMRVCEGVHAGVQAYTVLDLALRWTTDVAHKVYLCIWNVHTLGAGATPGHQARESVGERSERSQAVRFRIRTRCGQLRGAFDRLRGDAMVCD